MKIGVIVFLLALAFVAQTLPLGQLYAHLHPNFVALVILYWALSSANGLSYFLVWTIGILQDLLEGTVLGSQGIALVVMVFLLYAWIQRVRRLPSWEQLFFIFVLLLVERLTAWLWQAWTGTLLWENSLLMGPALGATLWPLLVFLFEGIERAWPGKKGG